MTNVKTQLWQKDKCLEVTAPAAGIEAITVVIYTMQLLMDFVNKFGNLSLLKISHMISSNSSLKFQWHGIKYR